MRTNELRSNELILNRNGLIKSYGLISNRNTNFLLSTEFITYSLQHDCKKLHLLL